MRISENTDFVVRLRRAMKMAKFSIADAARWFDKPFATVRHWVTQGKEPYGPAAVVMHRRLALLEKAIEIDTRLPVPLELSPRHRVEYIKDLIRRHEKRDPDLPSPRVTV